MGILFVGLAMQILGTWQLLSTIANLAGADEMKKSVYRIHLIIASLFTIEIIVVFVGYNKSCSANVIETIMFIMFGISPIPITSYWIGSAKFIM